MDVGFSLEDDLVLNSTAVPEMKYRVRARKLDGMNPGFESLFVLGLKKIESLLKGPYIQLSSLVVKVSNSQIKVESQ